jgi:hypothetical protein
MRILAGCLLAGAGFSQNHEIGLTLGRIGGLDRLVAAGNLDIGSGTALQANYGYRVLNRRSVALYAEMHFLANPLREITSGIREATRDVATILVTPGIGAKFAPASCLSPYIAAGLGYPVFEQSVVTVAGNANPAPRTTQRGAINFGGGVDFQVWWWIGGRLEVRDFYTGNPSFNLLVSGGQHHFVAGGGFVLRLGSSE